MFFYKLQGISAEAISIGDNRQAKKEMARIKAENTGNDVDVTRLFGSLE